MAVEAANLDAEDAVPHRIAESTYEHEVLKSEDRRSEDRIRRIDEIGDGQTHQPVDEQGEDALPRRGQRMRAVDRQTQPLSGPVIFFPVEPGSFEPGTKVVTIDHSPSLRNPA